MKRLTPLILMGSVLILAGSAPTATAQQTKRAERETYTQAQFDELFKQISKLGRWGKNDQLGTLNLITPERKREAARLVHEGVSVSLARDLSTEKTIDNPDPFRDTMTLGVDSKFNMDTYTVSFHGFVFAHIDALSHTYYKGQLYTDFRTHPLPKKVPAFSTRQCFTTASWRAECWSISRGCAA